MIKLVLIAEIADADTLESAQAKLDDFRETVVPSMNYGITLYQYPELKAALEKYEIWCSSDKIRQKYANPAQVRDYILTDVRALLAKLEVQ